MTAYSYWIAIAIMCLGLHTMMAHRNLLKKAVGMTIFQTAIILFFLVMSIKRGATLPIVSAGVSDPAAYMNPLPHALMLTAIVVMVATSGVALAILVRLYARYGTLEEDAIAQQIDGEDVPAA